MRTGGHPTCLVRLLEQLGGCQSTLGPQRLVVLLAETGGLLEGAHDEGHGCQLCLAVADLVLIQGEGLVGEEDVDIAAGFSGATSRTVDPQFM